MDELCSLEDTLGRGWAHESIPQNVIVPNAPRLTDLREASPWWSIWTHQTREPYPPLYLVILRGWREMFGESDVAARALSLVGSLLAIVLLFDAVRIAHTNSAGLYAAALMALAGPQIHASQEARTYTLLLAAGAGACAAIARIERLGPTRRRLIALCVAITSMLLMHYFAWGAALGLAIYVAIQFRGQARRLTLIAMTVALVITLVIWGPFIPAQLSAVRDPAMNVFFADPGDGRFGRVLYRIAELPVRFLFESPEKARLFSAAGAVAFVLVPILVWRQRKLAMWALLIAGVIVPLIILDAFRATVMIGLMRYTLLASVGIFALIAAAFAERRDWLRHAFPAVFVLATALSLAAAYETWKSDWRYAGQVLSKRAQDGDVIVYCGSPFFGPYSSSVTYLSVSHYAPSLHGPIVILNDHADEKLLGELRAAKGVILVRSHLAPHPVEQLLPGSAAQYLGQSPNVASIWRITWENVEK